VSAPLRGIGTTRPARNLLGDADRCLKTQGFLKHEIQLWEARELLASVTRPFESMFVIDPSRQCTVQGAELVAEKISRPSPPPVVVRPRLLEILNQSLSSCASTIISGRAGAGKTVLAIDFSIRCGRPSAWYKVDSPDDELDVFFQYLIASVQKQRPGFGSKALARLAAIAGSEHLPLLAEVFVFELDERQVEPLLIVIEDLHLVCDAAWVVPFFQRWLPLLPSDVHVLITSRTLPPAPLWRMRSKQTLTVIDEEALAFTKFEAAELCAEFGLSPEQATLAFDQSRGRAASLISFAEGLAKKNSTKKSAASVDERFAAFEDVRRPDEFWTSR
jgi:ATP/maltotriose-dependent transcriptional regulator MalT